MLTRMETNYVSDSHSSFYPERGPGALCGSMLSELVVGRSVGACRELTADHLIEALDGVPPDKLHCPALAIAALRYALRDWETREDI